MRPESRRDTQTDKGMLVMALAFCSLLATIGNPRDFLDANIYAVVMSIASVGAIRIATRKGPKFAGEGDASIFIIRCISVFFAFAINFVGGYILTGNYTATTLTSSAVLFASTYFVCTSLEPSEEDLRDVKEANDFKSEVTAKIENVVRSLIQAHPELNSDNFGIPKHFTPLAFFQAWHFMSMAANATINLDLERQGLEAKSMELLESNELSITHNQGVHLMPASHVIGEMRVALSRWGGNETDCFKLLNWVRAAMNVNPKLKDLTIRSGEETLTLWEIQT